MKNVTDDETYIKELNDAIRELRSEVDNANQNVKRQLEPIDRQIHVLTTNLENVVNGHNTLKDDIDALAKEMNRFQEEGIAPLVKQHNSATKSINTLREDVDKLRDDLRNSVVELTDGVSKDIEALRDAMSEDMKRFTGGMTELQDPSNEGKEKHNTLVAAVSDLRGRIQRLEGLENTR
jgi:chromosome segregation ATPase